MQGIWYMTVKRVITHKLRSTVLDLFKVLGCNWMRHNVVVLKMIFSLSKTDKWAGTIEMVQPVK